MGKTRSPREVPIPESSTEFWKRKPSSMKKGKSNSAPTILHSLARMPWGGTIRKEIDGVQTAWKVTNTCSFDNHLTILYSLYRTNKQVADFINNSCMIGNRVCKNLCKIYNYMDKGNYEMAKTVCVYEIMQYPRIRNKDGVYMPGPLETGDFYGSEEIFLQNISPLIRVTKTTRCPSTTCTANITEIVNPMLGMWDLVNPLSLSFYLNNGRYEPCTAGSNSFGKCKETNVKTVFAWTNDGPPPFIAFNLPLVQLINPALESSLPKRQNILGSRYTLYAYTLLSRGHYFTIFMVGSKFYKYDGLYPKTLVDYQQENKYPLSSVYLVLEDI